MEREGNQGDRENKNRMINVLEWSRLFVLLSLGNILSHK